jgi:predicted kinase
MPRVPGDERSSVDRGADTPTAAPRDLSDRLERLPPGHPSSPYEADGTRRQDVPRLRDLDAYTDDESDGPFAPDSQSEANDSYDRTGVTDVADDPDPLTETEHPTQQVPRFADADWVDRRTEARSILDTAHGGEQETDQQHTVDPDNQYWTEERSIAHEMIIESIYASAKDVPNQYQAIIAGGLAGAGKSTILDHHAGIDRSQYLTIAPDDIKVELAERGLLPQIDGLSPMETADLAHDESSHIARQLALRAQADGKNLIWDITMSSKESTEDRIDNLRADGYTNITGIFVDVPVEVSLSRADARHRAGQEAFEAGKGLGGRYMPPEAILSKADEEWGSKNRRAFEELKPRFDQWVLFDNSVEWRDPIVIEASPRVDSSKETTP